MIDTPVPARAVARPTLRRVVTVGLVATVLAGCGTAPLSYLNDRQVYYRAVINRYPVFVSKVDGKSTAFRPVPITPGEHLLTLDATPVAGFSQPVEKTYPLTVAPCTRYYIAAQRTSPLTQDWDLVVETTWPVAGCDPAQELEKAKTLAISHAPARASSVVEIAPPATVALGASR